MPSLANHHSGKVTKLLLMGDSGTGKSGALASLAHAGYNVRILDFDNGLDGLVNLLTDPKSPYDKSSASRVHYKTLTEPMKNVAGKLVPTRATAWPEAVKLLTHWREPAIPATSESPEIPAIDLGPVNTWGEQDVLVIDTLTFASEAAMNYHLSLQGALNTNRTQNEHRRDIGAAQGLIENMLETLYDTSLKCNIVVNSHITYATQGGLPDTDDGKPGGPIVGYPSSMGKALSPKIPRYFNSVLLMQTLGVGPSAKRKLYTSSQGIVAAKTSAPLKVKPSYDIEFGLAEYFAAVRS